MPSLDEVKAQVKPYLERQKVLQMLDNLRKNAAVEIFMPLEEPAPKAADSAATAPAATKEAAQVTTPTESEKK
jgi:peptidyl-prolyl cis-trans isomerase C